MRYLAAAAALFALAIALPVLTQAMPVLSRLWLWQPWVEGIPALLIVGGVLRVLARAERSRSLALLAALYAGAALLASVFLTLTQEGLGLWWPATAGWRAHWWWRRPMSPKPRNPRSTACIPTSIGAPR